MSKSNQVGWEAAAYLLDNMILLHPLAIEGPPQGNRFFIEPIVSIKSDCDAAELGLACRQVLDRSVIDTELPENFRELVDQLAEYAGYSSIEQFVRSTVTCNLTRRISGSSPGFTLTPSRNGTGMQYKVAEMRYALHERAIELPLDATDTQLGEVLSYGFRQCG